MAYGDAKDPIEFLSRKGDGQMDEHDFQSVIKGAIGDCIQFTDTQLSLERGKATEYYLGKPFGNEEEGRSQVVLTEVRDAVDGMLPTLLRVAHPPGEHSVEFLPTRPDNVEQAEQKTDYVRYVFEQDCGGKMQSLAVFKDGLVRKIGIFAWGWDDSVDTKAYKQEGIDRQQLEGLAMEDDIELTSASARKDGFYDVEFTKTTKGGKPWVKALPPEELISNRRARSVEEASILGRRTEKTRGELLAMGISKEDIDKHGNAGDESSLKINLEELARRDMAGVGRSANFGYQRDPELGKANDKILYCDVLMNLDFDGDGIAELRRVCTIGPTYYPVKNDPADEKRFAIYCPYPEPHALIGGSVSDRTMDMQRINSSIFRAILDGAAASIFPRTVYVEGQASVADIMNTAIGAPIRERQINMVRTLETPFVGEKMIPLLGFTQEVIERRTGMKKGAAGLDADALQSTGKEAVNAVLSGHQEQLELLSVIYAEMALKPLFEGLGRLLQQKQPRERMVRLRGKWVNVDPKSWDSNMDVQVNVNLGSASTDKKIGTLMAVAADQENMLMTLGMANPMTSVPKFLNTRSKILALQGIRDFASYYNELPPDWQPPAPPAPEPDPKVIAMQAEAEMSHVKAMKELAIKSDELELKKQELSLRQQEIGIKQAEADHKAAGLSFDQAFQVEKLAVETETARLQIQATIDAQAADRALESARDSSSNDLKLQIASLESSSAKEAPQPTIHVYPPDVSSLQPPVVNVPAPIVHVQPPVVNVPPAERPQRGKRKAKVKKEKDGSYSIETDEGS